jgi:hypothetical protein
MSVKFERETIRQGAAAMSGGAGLGPLPGTSGKHPIAEAVGTALTGGEKTAGTKGYLAVRFHASRTSILSRSLREYGAGSEKEGSGKIVEMIC